MFHSKITCGIVIILLGTMLFSAYPDRALCSEDKLVPSIQLRQEYTDNLFMTANDVMDDFILTASPGLKIITRSARLKLDIAGHLDSAWYYDNTDLNGNDIGASGRLTFDATEKLNLSTNANFARDSRPDRDLDETGLLLNTTRRHRYQGGVAGNYILSEKTSATISSSYSQDDYQSKTDDQYDFQSYTAGMSIFHRPGQFNQRITLFCNTRFSRYDYDNATVDYYAITAGMENNITETFSIRFDLGARYTVSEFLTYRWILVSPPFGYEIASVEEKSTNHGGVGQISLNYNGEFIHCAMSAAHDIQPASGREGSAERTSLGLSFSKRFTEELRCVLDGSYYFNNAAQDEFSSIAIDEETLRWTAKFRYDVTRLSLIETGWSYTRIADDIDNTTVDRNLAFISYVYNFEID